MSPSCRFAEIRLPASYCSESAGATVAPSPRNESSTTWLKLKHRQPEGRHFCLLSTAFEYHVCTNKSIIQATFHMCQLTYTEGHVYSFLFEPSQLQRCFNTFHVFRHNSASFLAEDERTNGKVNYLSSALFKESKRWRTDNFFKMMMCPFCRMIDVYYRGKVKSMT